MATRRERVVLELEDNFTTGMARAAASAALLNRELNSLSKDSVRTRRSVSDIDQPIQNIGRSAGNSGKEVDKMSGRMRILADVTAILGPGLVGIGAVGVPVVTTLAAQFGFAATAAGTAILAFQGVGDTLKALNAAALDPTTANLNKAEIALEKLSPAAQGFVAQLGNMMPELKRLRDIAAQGLFPGLTQGLADMESALPHVQGLIGAVSGELGKIGAATGASLASDKWTSFLDFLAQSAPKALGDMATAAGNTAHALAELWMATDPANNNFSSWIVDATQKLDAWATGLSKTQGFADFVAYLDATGPKVAETFGALANAVLQIVQAAAPLSGPVLEGVTALANLVSNIANSDLGTPLFTAVAALSLFNRTLAITDGLQKSTFGGGAVGRLKSVGGGFKSLTTDLRTYNSVQNTAAGRAKATAKQIDAQSAAAGRLGERVRTLGRTSALIAGVGIAASGTADKIGLTNTASLALMGTFIEPGWGTALGAAAGSVLDLKAAVSSYNDTLKQADQALHTNARSQHEAALAALQQQAHYLATSNSFKANVTRIWAFAKAHTTGTGAGDAGDQLINRASELKQALRMDDARAQQSLLQQGFRATASGIDVATQSAQKFQTSLENLNQVLTGRASARDFEQALDDFKKRAKDRAKVQAQIKAEDAKYGREQAKTARDLASAKTPGQKANILSTAANQKAAHDQRMRELKQEASALRNTLDIGTQAGRDTQALLDNIAASALKVAQGLSGADRVKFLAAAHEDFVKAAEAAGLASDAAQKLADKVLGLKGVTGRPSIVIDANGAWHVITETQRRMNDLKNKKLRIDVVVNQAHADAVISQVMDIHNGRAEGGTIQGKRYPYADKVLVPLAPGEEVITNRNGEADRWRPLLKRINAGMANGGTVPFPSMAAGGPVIDYDRLASAMSAVRPLYGDVTVQPHNYSEFRRQMDQDRRLAGMDGVRR